MLLESGFAGLWIEGEISNFARPSSGHWYFTLKDREAQLRCAMWRTRNALSGFTPVEGQQVLARGRISLYEARGDYQLIVEHIEEAGLGALKRAFEELKARLQAEGLFAIERKRALPAAPLRIGIITSPTGAAVRDVLHILARRFPAAAVLIYPVPVQGAAAAPAIAAALDLANARAECDVLILTRGGGSLEDLWAFNDERVARAIHRSGLPVVTGIGHEVDFTIADFVADVRAPTPSGAAELAVPDFHGWLGRFRLLAMRFAAAMRRQLVDEHAQLRELHQRLQRSHPGTRLAQHMQRLDELEQRLERGVRQSLQQASVRYERLNTRLLTGAPLTKLREWQLQQQQFSLRLRAAVLRALQLAGSRFELAASSLQGVSPLATLARGFAIVTRVTDGTVLRNSAVATIGEQIDARLASGSIRARVIAKD
jgi:exodeoxyribonuclease VII large subunit